jgi:tetratricopeptide (TPR) repeat protein
MPPSAGMRFGRYELLSRLGAGGMGEVFRARDHDLHRDVALKFLPERFAADPVRLGRFAQEARAASSLNHPNIVTIHEIGETSGLPYIVMELVDGQTLRELVEGPPLPARRVLGIAAQLADGLAKAHEAGIVHRDLKPENVMVTADGFVKILDFGLAKLRSTSPDVPARPFDSKAPTWPDAVESPMTAAGTVFGTAGYMSPEQARGHPVSFRSDQFAFGAIVYEMATGRQAFRRETTAQTLTAIIESSPEPLETLNPSFPPPARWIVERCLEKEPSDRYASTLDLAREVHTVRERLPEMGSGSSPPRSIPGGRARGSWPGALRVGAATLAVLALAWGVVEIGRRVGAPLSGLQRPPVIAVMPLANLTGETADDATAVGLTEVVVGALSAIDDVQVLSRSATLGYVDRRDDLPAVARELDASYLLDGVLQRSQDELRISLSLVQVPSNVVEWSSTFDGGFPRLFELQSRVAQGVAQALRLNLSAEGRSRIEAHPTASPSAWEDYTTALALLDRADQPGHIEGAITHVEAALEKDPRFARAHALLGRACWYRYHESREPRWADRARDAVQEALRLDPDDADVRLALAEIYVGRGRVKEAFEELRRVRRERPSTDDGRRQLAMLLAEAGQLEAAREEIHGALEVRPRFAPNHEALGWIQYSAGRWDEAAEAYRRATELEPDNPWAFQMLGAARHQAGDLDGAAAAYTEAIRLAPDARAWANLGYIHYERDQMDGALEAYDEAVRLAPRSGTIRRSRGDTRAKAGDEEGAREDWSAAVGLSQAVLEVNPHDVEQLSNVAVCRAKLGQRESALKAAEKALAAGPESWLAHYLAAVTHALVGDETGALDLLERALELGASAQEIARNDDLAAVRRTPRFQTLTGRAESSAGEP